MNRIDRLMAIITLLQGKKRQTASQIAQHFAISERTVYRDLRAIGEIGIPIEFEPEKGYAVGNGFFLPPVSLTVDEAYALSLAAPLVTRFAEKEVQRHFEHALAKIKMVMNRKQRDEMDRAQDLTRHYIPDQYAHLLPGTDYLIPLQSAIHQQKIVLIQYENAEEAYTERIVEPIGLIFYSLNWHLIAWCHLRKDYRDFRTNRIRNLKVTIRPFEKKDHIPLEIYLREKSIVPVSNQ